MFHDRYVYVGFPTYCDLVVEVDLAKALRGLFLFNHASNIEKIDGLYVSATERGRG